LFRNLSFRTHFPEKNREFAAICGKLKRDWGESREVLEQVEFSCPD
jgi:hypothetical protein